MFAYCDSCCIHLTVFSVIVLCFLITHNPDVCLLLLSQDLLSIVASVLHLGNVQFAADEQGNAQVTIENQIKYLARVSIISKTYITCI